MGKLVWSWSESMSEIVDKRPTRASKWWSGVDSSFVSQGLSGLAKL